MASCGLEAVSEPLEEAASRFSLDSLRDHKKRTFSSNLSRVKGICHEVLESFIVALHEYVPYERVD